MCRASPTSRAGSRCCRRNADGFNIYDINSSFPYRDDLSPAGQPRGVPDHPARRRLGRLHLPGRRDRRGARDAPAAAALPQGEPRLLPRRSLAQSGSRRRTSASPCARAPSAQGPRGLRVRALLRLRRVRQEDLRPAGRGQDRLPQARAQVSAQQPLRQGRGVDPQAGDADQPRRDRPRRPCRCCSPGCGSPRRRPRSLTATSIVAAVITAIARRTLYDYAKECYRQGKPL